MEALSDDEEVSTGRPDLQIRLNLGSGPAGKPQAKPLAPSNRNAHFVMPGEAMQQTLKASCLLHCKQQGSPRLLDTAMSASINKQSCMQGLLSNSAWQTVRHQGSRYSLSSQVSDIVWGPYGPDAG